MHICIYIYTYIYIHINIHAHTHTHTHTYIYRYRWGTTFGWFGWYALNFDFHVNGNNFSSSLFGVCVQDIF